MLKNIGLSAVTVGMALSGALPAFAETEATTSVKVRKQEKVVNVACIQSAIDKRDTALVSAVGSFSSSVQSALTTRKDALKSAWAQADRKARKEALATAWNAYKKSSRSAKESLGKSRKSAWETYKTEAKACNATDDAMGSGVDNFGI